MKVAGDFDPCMNMGRGVYGGPMVVTRVSRRGWQLAAPSGIAELASPTAVPRRSCQQRETNRVDPASRRRLAQHRGSVDTTYCVVQNRRVLIEFAQSARKHRIGRARVRQVVANPLAQAVLPAQGGRQERLVFLGDDQSGSSLEVVAVRKDGVCW